MIKATDIRLGNIVGAGVLFNDEGDEIGPMPSLVKEIDSYEIKWSHRLTEPLDEYGSNSTSLECVVGIRLTPEWLIKLGFKKEGVYKDATYYEICLGKKDEYPILYTGLINGIFHLRDFDGDTADNISVMRPILFVHQLQNLFHSLTQEELIIKP